MRAERSVPWLDPATDSTHSASTPAASACARISATSRATTHVHSSGPYPALTCNHVVMSSPRRYQKWWASMNLVGDRNASG